MNLNEKNKERLERAAKIARLIELKEAAMQGITQAEQEEDEFEKNCLMLDIGMYNDEIRQLQREEEA